jgi:uncharacterized protein (UPF0548 family)
VLTYFEVGATRYEPLPAGYQHVRRHVRLGTGEAVFAAAADALARWQPQREGRLLAVRTEAERVEIGARIATGLGVGPLRLWAPCEVVYVVAEPDRYGWAYGTLEGHPESGEEGFFVTLDADGTVWFDVRAFSRPAHWYVKLGQPVARFLQERVTSRYVAAMRAAVRPPRTSPD